MIAVEAGAPIVARMAHARLDGVLSHPHLTTVVSARVIVAAAITVALALPASGGAQSLRGSPASVARMYRGARAEGLRFYTTPAAVRAATRSGKLARIASTENVAVDDDVRYPYARPTTGTFVERLGAQYHAACGERLVVTSGVRPSTRQPANATRRSVHPTGMAVDLRKPEGRCLTWLRRSLLDLEQAGVIEATEEHDPAHFHVAVFQSTYRRYLSPKPQTSSGRVASN